MTTSKNTKETTQIVRNTFTVLGIVIAALFLWQIRNALLIAFAGAIFAVILTGFAQIIRNYIPVSRVLSLILVGIVIILMIGSFTMLFGPQIVDQFHELVEKLPERIEDVKETIGDWPMAGYIINNEEENGRTNENEEEPEEGLPEETGDLLYQFGINFIDFLTSLGLLLAAGIYFAIDPDTYKNGITLLFSKSRADRVSEVLDTTGKALWLWLSGQMIAMVFVGVSTTIGLLVIGVPLPFALGVISGLANFIPILGPIVAYIPALLLAFSVDTNMVIYTTLLYIGVQQIESNIVMPLVQKRMVHLPPAIILLNLVTLGLIFGIPGIILATPLTVIAMVFIGMFYVQDVLGKEVTIPGSD